MSWRDSSPIRYLQALPGRALRLTKRVAKPPLRAVVSASRSIVIRMAHRSPWLHARLRRYRYYDHRLRMLFGVNVSVPPVSTLFEDAQIVKSLPAVWRHKGHNDACKSPLESWFNQ